MFKSSAAGARAHCSYVFCMLAPQVIILNHSQIICWSVSELITWHSMLQVGLSTPIHTNSPFFSLFCFPTHNFELVTKSCIFNTSNIFNIFFSLFFHKFQGRVLKALAFIISNHDFILTLLNPFFILIIIWPSINSYSISLFRDPKSYAMASTENLQFIIKSTPTYIKFPKCIFFQNSRTFFLLIKVAFFPYFIHIEKPFLSNVEDIANATRARFCQKKSFPSAPLPHPEKQRI